MPRQHGHTRLPGKHEGILVWWVEDLHFLEKTSGVYPCGNVHECGRLQSRKSDHLELEGQAIVSCLTRVLGSKLGSFARAI